MRFAKNTQHDTSKVLRLPRKMTMDTSKVLRLPRKLQHIFWKRRKSIAPATQNDFRHVPEHVWMSRSATPATRNEATRRLKPPKRTTSAKLPIGTAIRSSRERLRTVANGCGRLRPWTQRRANTPSTPRPPEWNGNPCYAFGNNCPFNFAPIWKPLGHSYPGSLLQPTKSEKTRVFCRLSNDKANLRQDSWLIKRFAEWKAVPGWDIYQSTVRVGMIHRSHRR